MTTEAIQLLHTTPAYQAAVMELMVVEANFFAERLGINERVPNAPEGRLKDWWSVARVPEGIGGTVASANYSFHFMNGRLWSLKKIDWIQKIYPPVSDLSDLADRAALLDADGAYAWAKELLGAVGVDVSALEAKCPPQIFQVPGRRRDSQGNYLRDAASLVRVPVFYIGWGNFATNPRMAEIAGMKRERGGPPDRNAPVYMQIFGTTQEVVELRINDASVLRRPILKLDNAEELLGTAPSPREFVEKLFGGKAAYETVAAPDGIEIVLFQNIFEEEKRMMAGPVKLTGKEAKGLSDILLSFDTYVWGLNRFVNMMEYGGLVETSGSMRFTKGNEFVEIWLSFLCSSIQVMHAGRTQREDFGKGRTALVKAFKEVFVNDPAAEELQ